MNFIEWKEVRYVGTDHYYLVDQLCLMIVFNNIVVKKMYKFYLQNVKQKNRQIKIEKWSNELFQ